MWFAGVDILAFAHQVASSDLVSAIGPPLLVFLARVSDVTLQTVRIILLSSGKKRLAPLLGFFEVLIWIVVISHLVRELSNVAGYLAYAGGFAAGTATGIWLDRKLAIGTVLVRVITVQDATPLIAQLRTLGYGVTAVEAQGATGPAHLLYTVIARRRLTHVLRTIEKINPGLFVSVEPISSVSRGIFPATGLSTTMGVDSQRLGK